MKVSNWMMPDVSFCRPEDTLDVAAAKMFGEDTGGLPIVGEKEIVVGMLTDRDICMCGLIEGKPLTQLPVSLAMSKQIWTCKPEDTLETACETMKTHHVTRLPVVDKDLKLVGLLGLRAMAAAEKKGDFGKRGAFIDLVQSIKTRKPGKTTAGKV